MKSFTFITLLCLAFCSISLANSPEKIPLQSYSKLWTNSPFTTPPVKIGPAVPENSFKDYHLTGIAPVEGGYRITISHKKNNNERVVIEPGTAAKFQVLRVERNPEITLGTVVTLTDGRVQGEVRFEPTLVVLNTPTNAKPADKFPPGFDPNQQNQPNNGQVSPPQTPRSRIVPPVKNKPNPPTNNSQSRPSRTR